MEVGGYHLRNRFQKYGFKKKTEYLKLRQSTAFNSRYEAN